MDSASDVRLTSLRSPKWSTAPGNTALIIPRRATRLFSINAIAKQPNEIDHAVNGRPVRDTLTVYHPPSASREAEVHVNKPNT